MFSTLKGPRKCQCCSNLSKSQERSHISAQYGMINYMNIKWMWLIMASGVNAIWEISVTGYLSRTLPWHMLISLHLNTDSWLADGQEHALVTSLGHLPHRMTLRAPLCPPIDPSPEQMKMDFNRMHWNPGSEPFDHWSSCPWIESPLKKEGINLSAQELMMIH